MTGPGRSTAERIRAAVAQAQLTAHGADPASINRAYRKLAAVAHPDVGGDAAQFRRLVEARDRLLKASRRREGASNE